MPTVEPSNQSEELERLKLRFRDAIARKFSADDFDELREHQFFLERLQFRLQELGLTPEKINHLAKPETINLEAQASAPSVLSHKRSAILVIHGIGQQNPYETLDQFARNLMRYLKYEGGIEDITAEAGRIDRNDWVEAVVRLHTRQHGPQAEAESAQADIDLYEYYWAPQTQDKISYKQTLSWLIKTTLTPLRMLDSNMEMLKDESDEHLTAGAIWGREMWRIILIYVPLLLLLGLLSLWLPKVLDLREITGNIAKQWSADHPITRTAMTFFFLVSAFLYWVVLRQAAAKWLRWMRQQVSIMPGRWPVWTLLLGVISTSIGIALGKSGHVNLAQYFHPVLNPSVLQVLATVPVARLLQVILGSYLGDVAVYVNADAKSKNFAARRTILTGAVQAVTRLMGEDYEQIIVAGHSLGSVIAYDTLNELMNRSLAIPDPVIGITPPKTAISKTDLERIKGLVTFGSPLDKIQYFFRDFVPMEQSVRAQLLSFLHSFRKRRSHRDYGIYRFLPYSADRLEHLRWLNAWSLSDPVSGALHFYEKVERQHFNYLIPIYAHLSYWEDLRFYEFFARPLLLGEPVTAPLKAMRAAV